MINESELVELLEPIVVKSLTNSYKLLGGDDCDIKLRGALLTVIQHYTTQEQYKSLLDELLG